MRIKGIILDLDGTILDSFKAGMESLIGILLTRGIRPSDLLREKLRRAWGKPGIKLICSLGISEDVAESIYFEWNEWEKKNPLPLIFGVRETLKYLNREGIKLSILTSRTRESVEWVLKKNRVASFFHSIHAFEDSEFHKPDSRVTIPIIERMRIKPYNILGVGDALYDIECYLSSHMKAAAVLTGSAIRSEFRTMFPNLPDDNILFSIADLPGWIECNDESL